MGLIHVIKSFGLTIRESANDGSDFTNPDADYRVLFLGEDGLLHLRDSAGTVTDIGGGGVVVQDEGTPLATTGTTLNFVGAGVAASGTGATKTITVSGGGSAVVPWSISPEGGSAPVTVRSVGTANRATYAPCTIPAACTVTGVRIDVLTQSGNISVGLYDESGSRVATSGAVACPAAGVQSVSFTGTYSAAAARYYIGFSCDNTTATFAYVEQVANGLASPATSKFQASAHPLPTTASFGVGAVSTPSMVLLISGGHP